MYKIFVNDKPLYLVKNFSDYQAHQTSLLLKYNGIEDLAFGIQALQEQAHILSLMIFSSDLETLWGEFRRGYTEIHAAGGLVKNADGKFLLIFRNGKWDLPKGKVEPGEELEKAAIREVEEECGITNLNLGLKLPSTYHTYERNNVKVLKETTWFEMSYDGSQGLVPQEEEGIEKAEWIDSSGIQEVKTNAYASINDVLP